MKKIYFMLFIIILVICVTLLSSFTGEAKQKKNSGKIIFCQHDGQYWQIWIMDLDGVNKKKLTDSKIDKRSPDFSSDGKKIVYVTNEGKLMTMDSNGGNQKEVPLNIPATGPKWCFQDKKIVFASYRGISFLDDSDIWMADNDGSKLLKVICRPSLQFLPDISKDGKELVFVDVLEAIGHKIFKFNLQTKDSVQLTQSSYYDTSPVFTPDVNTIVYSSDRDGNYDIWTMDRFGQNQKNLTHRPAFDSCPALAKDGKTIFFLSDDTGTMEIWSTDIDGTLLKQITNDGNDKEDISVYAP